MNNKKDHKRLRPGDQVVVIAGNEKGRAGKLLSRRGSRVVIEGVNIRKKHMKPTQQNQKGQRIDIECPIHVSNVAFAIEGTPRKLRVRVNSQGERELYYLEEGNPVLLERSVKEGKV